MTEREGYPMDAASIRDEIRGYLRSAVADAGSSLDSGGGFGEADVYVTVDGKEYVVIVRSLRPTQDLE